MLLNANSFTNDRLRGRFSLGGRNEKAASEDAAENDVAMLARRNNARLARVRGDAVLDCLQEEEPS